MATLTNIQASNVCVPHFLLDGMMISHACNRPNRSRRVFRAVWMFYMRENRRNELVVSIATLAINALSRFGDFTMLCACEGKKGPTCKKSSDKRKKTLRVVLAT